MYTFLFMLCAIILCSSSWNFLFFRNSFPTYFIRVKWWNEAFKLFVARIKSSNNNNEKQERKFIQSSVQTNIILRSAICASHLWFLNSEVIIKNHCVHARKYAHTETMQIYSEKFDGFFGMRAEALSSSSTLFFFLISLLFCLRNNSHTLNVYHLIWVFWAFHKQANKQRKTQH